MLIFLALWYLLTSVSLYFIFPKANQEAWKALVPGLNILTGCEISGKPKWRAIQFLIPIVNIFAYAALAIDIIRSFGKHGFWHWFAVVVGAPFYFFWLGCQKDLKYTGPVLTQEAEYAQKIKEATEAGRTGTVAKLMRKNPYKKSAGREWAESIIFAVFAAAFLRMFLFEAYIIPTSSMEGSLKQGDFLFVSKMAYGVRMPQTIAMVPLLHNRIPILNTESYLKKPQLKYTRTKALETIDLNDPIVFNWPIGDSVYLAPGRSYGVAQARWDPYVKSQVKGMKLRVRPMDKKDHYIKRCLGTPGDSLVIRDRVVYINGEEVELSENAQFGTRVLCSRPLSKKQLRDMDIYSYDIIQEGQIDQGYVYEALLSEKEQEEWLRIDPSAQFTPLESRRKGLWPYNKEAKTWDADNYGPIWIPKAGATVELSEDNIAFFAKAIRDYEHNDFSYGNGKYYIDGQEITSYTFKQDYYWGMGDNRHGSEDSRAWGYIPHDHIVGKPSLIWMSLHEARLKDGIHWKRLFKKGDIF